jgi:hypothetical protein
MPTSPLVVSWPGGIGNPINEKIVTSGGRRRSTRRRSTRKNARKSCRSTKRKSTRRSTRR